MRRNINLRQKNLNYWQCLEEVIEQIRRHKERRWDWNHTQTPFISPFYNWFVLDNMTVSPEKINLLEAIFLGTPYYASPNNSQDSRTQHVKLTKLNTSTKYDSLKKQYSTWVDLEITDTDTSQGRWQQGEFETFFELPEGVWISDYYLWIEKEKVHGLLAEKKAAMWVYQQITATRRDPGILNYVSGNKIRFRVFPFSAGEVRKTGIELLHKEPLLIKNDSNGIVINQNPKVESKKQVLFSYDSKAAYLSASYKKTLPKVKRKPYLHFIVDFSESKHLRKQDYLADVEKIIKENPNLIENAKITLTNAYAHEISLNENWQEQFKNTKFEGGYYLDRALEQIVYDQIKNTTNFYPVLYHIGGDTDHVINEKHISDYPNVFIDNDKLFRDWDKTTIPVLAWKHNNKTYYLRNDNKASIVSIVNENSENGNNNDEKPLYTDFKRKDWTSALTLQGQYNHLVFSPETTETMWLPLVKGSFDAQVMTPLTSFISLENEAQRQALLYKQQQVLNSKKSLDIPDTTIPQSMDEPSWWVCGLILLALLGWKKFK